MRVMVMTDQNVTCETHIRSAAPSRLVGSEHVGLGSDWDGAVAVPAGLDAAGVAQARSGGCRLTDPLNSACWKARGRVRFSPSEVIVVSGRRR